ncbi:hypothetical protein PVNG_05940 [Plasmodium vivax North Korean]|uniref:Variable surface protein n=1 Tax=Plasmodium vivax North Korean TaxID=1035514 RepID=A0A0J9TLQ6_PLAVI|nr:hypothetical protein PVNG_05940 [Plasmodium vivax North Korean]
MRNGLNICFKRYLAEYEGETNINKTGLYKNSPYDLENKGTSNYDDNVSVYGNMKNRDSKKLKIYKTAYKHRYAKKKGLSKLDCYYENKIFDKLDGIFLLAKNMNDDKKGFIKKICKRYGLTVGLFLIIVLTAGMINVLNGCKVMDVLPKENYVLKVLSHVGYCILLDILPITIFLVLVYITIKITKYKRLKAGKGKMCIKEYCRFCKDLIL